MFTFHQQASAGLSGEPVGGCSFRTREPYRSLFAKWGFSLAGEGCVQTYQYRCLSKTEDLKKETDCHHDASTAAARPLLKQPPFTVPTAALRFHHGVASDFLRDLFASSLVRAQLVNAASGRGGASQAIQEDQRELRYVPLTCHWTTLAPLRQALVEGKVVRQMLHGPGGDDKTGSSVEEGEAPLAYRLPTVKRAEETLPHGEIISDELRALFLRAHGSSCGSETGDAGDLYARQHHLQGMGPYGGEESEAGKGTVGSTEEEEEEGDDEDGEDGWGCMSGARIPLRQLRRVFSRDHRREFLYHILWRLIAGGGPMNQYEDDAAVYLDAARELFRSWITSYRVAEVDAEGEADVAALDETERVTVPRYVATVESLVYEIGAAPGLQLFPSKDGVCPSNLNYCYVIVNPWEQTVTVWYHRC